MTGLQVGRVKALYRFPVKSTAGQSLERASVTVEGLASDRRWAAYTEDGGVASGKRTRRFRPVPGLMGWASSAVDDDDVPVLTSPEGVQYRVDDPDASDALTSALRQRLTLRPESTVQHRDESPLHLLTTSSLAAVEGLLGGPVDERRFRANIIVDTGDASEFTEDEWVGADVAVGRELVLHVGPGMPRCAMVDQPQRRVPVGRKALTPLGVHHGTELGVQACAAGSGTIRVGDVLTLLSPVHR